MPDRNSRRRQAPRWAPRSHPFPVSRAVRPARPSSWACRRFLSPDAEPPTCLEFDGRPSRLAVTARGTLRSRTHGPAHPSARVPIPALAATGAHPPRRRPDVASERRGAGSGPRAAGRHARIAAGDPTPDAATETRSRATFPV
jgi:hypothetical protein